MDKFLKQTFNSNTKPWLYGFLAIILVLNTLQAYLTGLHADEAYYWVYAQFLDWGYFDHPPFVALFIKAGTFVFKNPLGLRLATVISHVASVFLLWQIVKKYVANVQLFILIISSILLFHVYSFITTPDVPLFFFSVLFLYCYQIYLEEDKAKWAILLGVICAGLMYSKYHGILLIIFILLSNLNLFKRKSFYLIIVLAVVLCLPHLYWQYLNGYPSFYYHLIDRSATPYRYDYTLQYFLDQVLMMGPLVGWLLFYYGLKLKTNEDLFLRGLKFVFYGVFLFFFLSTFKGRVQAQWPLIEMIALFIMAYVYAGKNLHHFAKFKWLFGVNIFLILLARFILMGAIAPANNIKFVASFQNYDTWAKQVDSAAKGNYVLFQDGFQEASYFNFYTQSLSGLAYNSINYRQTQYDLWPLENQIQGKKVLLIGEGKAKDQNSFNIQTIKGTFNGTWIDSVRFYPKINFEPLDFPQVWLPQEEKVITFKIKNPYQKTIDFSNKNEKWKCRFQYGLMIDGRLINIETIETEIPNLNPQESKLISVKIKAPKESGDYKLFLSIKTEPFAGTRNSKMIALKVK
jgi:hypothetical protein